MWGTEFVFFTYHIGMQEDGLWIKLGDVYPIICIAVICPAMIIGV